jgi:DNA-binding MarR family transcriptional regulator
MHFQRTQILLLKADKNIDNINVTQEELQVLLLLEKKGKCLYGNIFKELNISHIKVAETILSLTDKGYIKNAGRPSFYELAIDLI